jgi:hypothetical protein
VGAARRGARANVILELEGSHALAKLFFLSGSGIALGLDFGFAFTVCGLGLFEDIEDVPTLGDC